MNSAICLGLGAVRKKSAARSQPPEMSALIQVRHAARIVQTHTMLSVASFPSSILLNVNWPLDGTALAHELIREADLMRLTWTILGLATSACLTFTPVYADSHGRPALVTQHAHAPQTIARPTTTAKPTTSRMLNPIAQKISSHPQLASKVHALLPAGTTLNRASAHFKNQGQFLAALHVSKNLGIPFSKLKADMTGAKHLSLGQSIQAEKPRANATTETRHAETEADDDVRTTTTTTTSSTSVTSTTPPPTSPARLNPIARKISSHPSLAAKVEALLPAGMTLNQASKGFKNQGQFLAALHVSKNLNIPFAQLKAEMTGKDHDSLGVAIQELKQGTNANAAVSTAEKEADADVKATTPQPGPHQGDKDGDDL